jgi:hypothetical protein
MSRTYFIRLRKEYKNAEPEGIEFEKSFLFEKIFLELWKDRITREHIAQDLKLPVDELNGIIFGLTGKLDGSSSIETVVKLKAV